MNAACTAAESANTLTHRYTIPNAARPAPRPRFGKDWVDWFLWNQDHQSPLPWEDSYRLTPEEARSVARSVGIFQVGEGSDGAGFRAAAKDVADRTGDRVYLIALDLFIAEENRHSHLLGRWMTRNGLPRLSGHWTDGVFRVLRHLGGLDVCITVLVTAELFANVYYRALAQATACPVMKAICRQILHDESRHIRFQCGQISKMRRFRSRWICAFAELLHAGLLLGTTLVVWKDHRPVFRAAHISFRTFARDGFREFRRAVALIRRGVHRQPGTTGWVKASI